MNQPLETEQVFNIVCVDLDILALHVPWPECGAYRSEILRPIFIRVVRSLANQ